MNTLPPEIVALILDAAPYWQLLRRVCKLWHALIGDKAQYQMNICEEAAANGDLGVLEWAAQHRFPHGITVGNSGIRTRNVEVLNWFAAHGGAFNLSDVIRNVWVNGNLPALEWLCSTYPIDRIESEISKYVGGTWNSASVPLYIFLRGLGICTYQWAYREVVERGSADSIRWVVSNGEYSVKQICLRAAALGDIALLKWALKLTGGIEDGRIYPNTLFEQALSSGNIEMVEWCVRKGITAASVCYYSAAQSGSVEMLEWLLNNGYVFNFDQARCVALCGNTAVTKWIMARSKSMDFEHLAEIVARAVLLENVELLNWYVAAGYYVDVVQICESIQDHRCYTIHNIGLQQWILNYCSPTDDYWHSLCTCAARGNRLDMLLWAKKSGVLRFDPSWRIDSCMQCCSIELIEWLREHGYSINDWSIRYAKDGCNYSLLKWFMTHGYMTVQILDPREYPPLSKPQQESRRRRRRR